MFGISLTEILLVLVVAIVVVGPQKLPRMMAAVGNAIGRIRRFSTEMRRQTGIDEILRAEGLDGGLTELRSIMRGDLSGVGARGHSARTQGLYDDHVEYDRTREYPVEGPDAFGAIPEDLLDQPPDDEAPTAASGPSGPSPGGAEARQEGEPETDGDPRRDGAASDAVKAPL